MEEEEEEVRGDNDEGGDKDEEDEEDKVQSRAARSLCTAQQTGAGALANGSGLGPREGPGARPEVSRASAGMRWSAPGRVRQGGSDARCRAGRGAWHRAATSVPRRGSRRGSSKKKQTRREVSDRPRPAGGPSPGPEAVREGLSGCQALPGGEGRAFRGPRAASSHCIPPRGASARTSSWPGARPGEARGRGEGEAPAAPDR